MHNTAMDPRRTVADVAGAIIVDIAYRRCGYNLRGLSTSGHCPECGVTVAVSIHGDLLRYADPAWLESLARGIRLVLWGVVLSIIGGAIGAMIERGGGLSFPGPSVLASVVTLAFGLVGYYGAWLFTTSDPSGFGERGSITARKVVRFALLAALIAEVLSTAANGLPNPVGLAIAIAVLEGAGGVCGLIEEFAKLCYVQRLAQRIPDDKLARSARGLRWALAICLGIMIVGGGIVGVAAIKGGGASGPEVSVFDIIFGGGICVVGLAVMAFLIVFLLVLILLIRLRRAIRRESITARALWTDLTSAGGVH